MSSRILKKLNPEHSEIPKLTESSDECQVSNVAKKFNRFDILNSKSQSESDEKDDVTEEIKNDRKKNKKSVHKRKKKKKIKQNKTHDAVKSDNSDDEIERTVREINELLGEEPVKEVHQPKELSETEKLKELLNIQARHLDPSYEMMRITGSKRQIQRRKPRDRAQLKPQNMLIMKEDQWFPIIKYGLSMELLSTKDNIHYFQYRHDAKYKEAQNRLLDVVKNNLANSLVPLINEYPYHLDTLLQLSDVCRISDEHDLCVQLIKQGVYALEYVFHPMFNLTKGNCRLQYSIRENRAFHILLMKYTVLLGRRTFHRTALEFCKILLSVDPEEDPLATILLVDYHALRAQEYKWLIDLIEFWNPTRNLLQLPNVMYSYALAHFFSGQTEKANSLLQEALCMFPSVFLPLIEACSVEFDREISSDKYFKDYAVKSETDSLSSLVKIYVNRNSIIWKDAKVLTWLGENAKVVLNLVHEKNSRIADGERLRTKRYKNRLPRNILRHIIVCDLELSLLPVVDGRSLNSFDPFPPTGGTRKDNNTLRVATEHSTFYSFLSSLLPNYTYDNVGDNNIQSLDPSIREIHFRSPIRSVLEGIRDYLLSSRQEPRVELDQNVAETLRNTENLEYRFVLRADERTGNSVVTADPYIPHDSTDDETR